MTYWALAAISLRNGARRTYAHAHQHRHINYIALDVPPNHTINHALLSTKPLHRALALMNAYASTLSLDHLFLVTPDLTLSQALDIRFGLIAEHVDSLVRKATRVLVCEFRETLEVL